MVEHSWQHCLFKKIFETTVMLLIEEWLTNCGILIMKHLKSARMYEIELPYVNIYKSQELNFEQKYVAE